MSHYLVTGAAGFIGARTAEMLLDAGYHVTGLDSLNDYYDPRIKVHRVEQLRKREGFLFCHQSIEDRPALEELFGANEFDAVFNLAARAGVRASIEQPQVYVDTNITGTLNILDLMQRYGVGKLVLASTSSLYAGQPMPFVEDLPVNSPISPYAATKKAAEAMAYTYHHLYHIDVSVVRYFTVFGPAGRPDMSPLRFIRAIDDGQPLELYGDGTQSRDFTYIDDIARGTIAALQPIGYEVFNLGGGRNPITINEMIAVFESLIGRKAAIREGSFHEADMRATWADISKAKRLLGWEPRVSFEDGASKTVCWYQENRDWLREITF